MADPTVLEVYRREVTPELYRDVRELYNKRYLVEFLDRHRGHGTRPPGPPSSISVGAIA